MDGPVWTPLEQPFPVPEDAHVNAKGNLLFEREGQNLWVPAEHAQNGLVTVQPRTCSSCAAKAGPQPWNEGVDVLLVATTALIGVLALGATLFARDNPFANMLQ